jgi:hypothetical protein
LHELMISGRLEATTDPVLYATSRFTTIWPKICTTRLVAHELSLTSPNFCFAPVDECENSSVPPQNYPFTMVTATPASSVTGQGALLGLPSKSQLSRRGIDGYSLPENLIQDKDSLKTSTEEGLLVYKVTKVCDRPLLSAFPPFIACPQ